MSFFFFFNNYINTSNVSFKKMYFYKCDPLVCYAKKFGPKGYGYGQGGGALQSDTSMDVR
jgi:hypothetical protein